MNRNPFILSIVLGFSLITLHALAQTPDIAVSPLSIDFGQTVAGTFIVRPLTIANEGDGTLTVQSFPKDPCLKASPKGPYTIEPAQNVQVSLRFVACKLGAQTKTLSVVSDDADEPSVAVQLSIRGREGFLGLSDASKATAITGLKTLTSSAQWVDYNNDDHLDMFVTGERGNILCKNKLSKRFVNGTKAAKLGFAGGDFSGASWADVDNDGDLDLFLTSDTEESEIFLNVQGVFNRIADVIGSSAAEIRQENASGGIWLDFNNDSRIDLFVVRDGAPNALFKNQGTLQFVDVGASAGVDVNGPGRSAVAADFNNDGFQDIFITYFNQPNKLFLNQKNETFADSSQSSGVAFNGPSIQAIVADYDRDQDLDILVLNSEGTSILYKNAGNGKFQNATLSARLGKVKNVVAGAFADFDSDRDEDLLIVRKNGNQLFRNNGSGKFTLVKNIDLTNAEDPTTIAVGDFDGDGRPDAFVGDGGGSEGASNTLYLNSGEKGNWLALVLQGTESNRAAIGTQVVVRAGLIPQLKTVSGGTGQSQESLPVEFGLGSSQTVTVQVLWPNGKTQTLNNVAANQILKVIEN